VPGKFYERKFRLAADDQIIPAGSADRPDGYFSLRRELHALTQASTELTVIWDRNQS